MNRSIKFFIGLALLVGLFSFINPVLGNTETVPPLIMGYVELPPFSYTDGSGVTKGVLIKLARKTLKLAGVNFTAVSFPAGRLYQNLATGRINLFLGITTDRLIQGTTIVSKQPIGYLEMRAYRLGKKMDIQRPKDLLGKHTILISGFSYNGWAAYLQTASQEGNATIFTPSTHQGAFRMLRLGRGDYLLEYAFSADALLKKMKIPDLYYNDIEKVYMHFILSKKTPHAEKVLQRIENGYIKLLKKGESCNPVIHNCELKLE